VRSLFQAWDVWRPADLGGLEVLPAREGGDAVGRPVVGIAVRIAEARGSVELLARLPAQVEAHAVARERDGLAVAQRLHEELLRIAGRDPVLVEQRLLVEAAELEAQRVVEHRLLPPELVEAGVARRARVVDAPRQPDGVGEVIAVERGPDAPVAEDKSDG